MSALYCYGVILQIFIICIFHVDLNAFIWPVTTPATTGQIAHNFSEAIAKIVEHFYIGEYRRRHFQFLFKVKNPKDRYFFQDIVDETTHLLENSITIFLGNGEPIPISNDMQFCILLVDSTESLGYLYDNIIQHHLYISGSYFIVLHTVPTPNHYYEELYEASHLSLSAGISHANILIYSDHNTILLFHDVSFSEFHCKANVPVVHNKFTKGQWLHRNFYVAKSKNLHGCTLVCATWEDMPYFQIKPNSNGSNFMGLEGRLLEYLAERMNFTIHFRWLNKKEINRTIYDQSHILDELFENGTDFVFGAFHYKPRLLNDSYTPTNPYFLSSYYFVISSRSEPFDHFVRLLLPFASEIWFILIIILVGGNIVLFTLTHMDRKLKYFLLGTKEQRPLYNMLVISLGGPVARDPLVPFSRFLLMVWLLASFVLRTIYQGLMFKFIKNDLRLSPPKTLAELLAFNYTPLMTETVYNTIKNMSRLSKRAVILNDSEVNSFEMLRHPERYDYIRMSILTAFEYFGYFKQNYTDRNEFYVVPQILFTQQLSIYMRKNSQFLNRFNTHIESFVNEGLMDRWERFLLFDGRHGIEHKEDSPKVLDMSQLFGAFSLLIICLGACVCVFILEICMSRVKRHIKGVCRRPCTEVKLNNTL